MRFLVTSFLLLVSVIVVSGCRYDKEAHIASGMLVSGVVTESTGSPLKGCLASIGVGIAKELFDAAGNGVPDAGDIVATGITCRFTIRF